MGYRIKNLKTQVTVDCDSDGLLEAFKQAALCFNWDSPVDYLKSHSNEYRQSTNGVYTLLRQTTLPGEGNVIGRVYVDSI